MSRSEAMKHLIALALTLVSGTSNAAFRTLTFQKDIHPREARAWEYDKIASLSNNSEVTFKVEGEPRIEDRLIQLDAVITNSSPSKKTIYVVGDKDLFKLEIITTNQIGLREPKPSKPPMFALEIPAQTNVKVIGALPLDRYIYNGSPSATLSWSFQFWVPPIPRGTKTLTLPTQAQAKIVPFKIEFRKYTSDGDIKLVAVLKNVSPADQLFCKSSQVDFTWRLDSVDGTEVENAERLNVEYEKRPLTLGDCFSVKANSATEVDSVNIRKTADTYTFESRHVTYPNLKTGQYRVWFRALNSAVESAQPKVIDDAVEKLKTAKPDKSIHVTETSQDLAIP